MGSKVEAQRSMRGKGPMPCLYRIHTTLLEEFSQKNVYEYKGQRYKNPSHQKSTLEVLAAHLAKQGEPVPLGIGRYMSHRGVYRA